MSAAVEQRLARFRAARGSSSAATRLPPRSEEPPGKAAAPEASEGPDRGGQPRPVPAATEPARPLLLLALKVLLWAVLLALFAELELGLPFFVVSLLYWMYAGTRGPGERRPGELSAYSVFNPGCTPIAGTLTAEQLERELHYRPAAGR